MQAEAKVKYFMIFHKFNKGTWEFSLDKINVLTGTIGAGSFSEMERLSQNMP